MEPIEINAGRWYLRALRSDERVDDRAALADGGIHDPDYVGRRTTQWIDETHFSWAVCEPTTGELLAEVGLTRTGDDHAELTGWARPGHDVALDDGVATIRRFAEGALRLTVSG